ncbi:MAG TPA: class I SAM-dependent methyltransferase [Burkholderiales bacterium]|nr:class I SAM-dependent methyltransferase [Burkholderiales bacterium]
MGQTDIARAHGELAARQLAQGDYGAALETLSAALGLAPQVDSLWAQFSDLIRYFNLRDPVPSQIRSLLATALEHKAVDPGDLVRPISTLALSNSRGALAEPLLLRLFEDTVIRDPDLERTIVEARRRMMTEPLAFPVMVAIAHQCFNAEYVFDETPEERRHVDTLRPTDPNAYAVYASYRPLSTLERVNRAGIESLVRRQIDEPSEEKRLAGTISSIESTDDPVSLKVRAQYEENPYPRWVRTQAVVDPVAQGGSPRVLVAGCGTGQHAVATALRFPGGSVLAVDLSLASLAYAKRKSAELGVANVEYRQGDILALGTLGERFDLIECSGVLHHMERPLEGWRLLASLRKPGGRMRIGLYSEAGRRQVVRARELIAERGFKPDPQGIRAARMQVRQDPLLGQLARNEDFFSMSGCRDLLFHAHERRFTLPEVESMIAQLGLQFLGFEFPDSGLTARRFVERFPEDRNGVQLKNWHRFEQEFPDTFSRMYQFWVA